MEDFYHKLLKFYSWSEDDFKKYSALPSRDSFPSIGSFEGTKKAIERLKKAKEAQESVLVYGDYDCDGVMATSIMVGTLQKFGLKVKGYLPSRYLDGYGLTASNVQKIQKAGYSLIMTVDNGVSAQEALLMASTLKVDVIVLDHHEYEVIPPSIVSLIHPKTVNYTDPEISAGFLSYLFSIALLGETNDYYAVLAALSTLSDAMPLSQWNRQIVQLGISLLQEHPYPEITLLTSKTIIDENILAMEIIPKINAIGRMAKGSEINRLLHYFTTSNKDEMANLASWMEQINLERKTLTKEAASHLEIDPLDAAIVTISELPSGLNGLLASRLLEQYNKPVAVFSSSSDDPNVLVGSLRSKEGFDIMKAFSFSKVPFLSKGGHSFAGGVSLQKEDLGQFKKDFIFYALKHSLSKEEKELIPVEKEDLSLANFQLLRQFAPFGLGHEAPEFAYKTAVEGLTFSKDGKYLSSPLAPNVRLFSFAIGASNLAPYDSVVLAVRFLRNEWKGRESLDILADSFAH